MQDVINVINSHKPRSVKPITDNQITYIPLIEDDQIECQVPSYLISGKRTLVWHNEACFKLYFLKQPMMEPRKHIRYISGCWDLDYLVYNQVVYPFMFFINGRFIPWSCIKVVIAQEMWYVLINGSNAPALLPIIRNVKWAQIVSMPSFTRFDIDKENRSNILFSFNMNGEYTTGDDAVYFIRDSGTEINNLVYKFWETTSGVNAFITLEDTSVKLSKANCICFKNGLLNTGARQNIKRAHEVSVEDEYGKEHNYFAYNVLNEDIGTNPVPKFDSTMLTIGDGTNPNGDKLDFGVFINTRFTHTIDNISRGNLEFLQPHIQAQTAGTANPKWLQDLQVPFEMAMTTTKHYPENLADAIKTIFKYNASLFNEAFLKKSNLKIECHEGSEVLSWVNENGEIVLTRDHSNMVEEYILMLVNGELYKYTSLTKYETNKCTIPIQGVNDSDTIEFLRFLNVNNSETKITVKENDGFIKYDNSIISNDMVLFCHEQNDNFFDFPADGIQHFPVEYELETNDAGEIKINLKNPFYYGKQLTVVYKNRYKHFWFNLHETTDTYTVNLGDKFMYCNEYSKFLVFYNGRRLGSDHYRLTLPVRTTTPFHKFDIYLSIPCSEGDRLDVIYVPSMFKDICMIPSIPVSGDIVVDKKSLGYDLSTDLYMVWVNGKKIPKDHVVDIDSTHMRIIADVQSTETVCITQYIPDIDILIEPFRENEALWDQVTAQLTKEEIEQLLSITGIDINNIEPSVYANAVDIRAIMFELIREQYIMNPRVDITNAFIYDYQDVDTTAIDHRDAANNAILMVNDANRQDNLDNVERPWP